MRLGTTELLVILGIAILLFGPTKIPQLGKAVGQTIGNFKSSMKKSEAEDSETEVKTAEAAAKTSEGTTKA